MEKTIATLDTFVRKLTTRFEASEKAINAHTAQLLYLQAIIGRLLFVVYRIDAEGADLVMSKLEEAMANEYLKPDDGHSHDRTQESISQEIEALMSSHWPEVLRSARKVGGLVDKDA